MNGNRLPAYQQMIDGFTQAGGDLAIIKTILGAKAEYLQAAFDETKSRYGTIENYFSQALEIDAAGQTALRERFLTGANGKVE